MKKIKSLTLTCLVTTATLGALLSSCGKKDESAQQAQAPQLQVLTVEQGDATL